MTSALLVLSLKMPLLSRPASLILICQPANLLQDANGIVNIHQLDLLLNNVVLHHQQQLPELLQLLLLQLQLQLPLVSCNTGILRPALGNAQ